MTRPLPFRVRPRPPKELPAVRPVAEHRLVGPRGEWFVVSPSMVARVLEELREFAAAAEAWHLYDLRVKQHAECRCGTTTHAPGPRGWKWRKITGPRYAVLKRVIGHGRRAESLCPSCQRLYGV